jgi:hypothetical protein
MKVIKAFFYQVYDDCFLMRKHRGLDIHSVHLFFFLEYAKDLRIFCIKKKGFLNNAPRRNAGR